MYTSSINSTYIGWCYKYGIYCNLDTPDSYCKNYYNLPAQVN